MRLDPVDRTRARDYGDAQDLIYEYYSLISYRSTGTRV